MRPAAPLLAAALLAAGGCGTERSEIPRDVPPQPTRRYQFERAGMTLSAPRRAALQRTRRPGVFRLALGQPFVSAFAYRRREQIPSTPDELRAARRRLQRAVGKRDPKFRLRSSRPTRIAGAPAIELVGDQTLSRGRLRTRSVHAFKGSVEYVLELLAPPAEYERLDRTVFEPLLRSLKLTGKLR